MSSNKESLRTKALAIYDRLHAAYGYPSWKPHLDPISQLVTTILSQNTSDVNQHRAFRRLQERFATWEAMRYAPLSDIEEAIHIAGMARQRAPRIQGALRYIMEKRGELSLDFLRELPVAEAKRWLTSIPGIGPKTAAIVLLFSLNMPAFPVDTHVHRVCLRLGLVPSRTTAPRTQEIMEELIPPDLYFPYHVNLIEHGRRVCKAQRPMCERCFLADLCRYAQSQASTS